MASNKSAVPGVQLQVAQEINSTPQTVTDSDGIASALALSTQALHVSNQNSPLPNTYFFIEPDSTGTFVSIGVYNSDTNSFAFPLLIDAQTIQLQSRSNGSVTFSGQVTFNGPVSWNDQLSLPSLQPISSAPSSANLNSVVVDTNTGTLYYL